MLKRSLFVSVLFASVGGAAYAQSPLPTFDTESGAPSVLESIIGRDTLMDISTLRDSDVYEKARIVARVEDLTGDGFCTGSRVGEDLFLTNYHCWEVYDCQVQFNMGYETGLSPEQRQRFKCVEVVSKLERLDYALYRVEAIDAEPAVAFPVARLSKRPLTVGMPLLVPGHPAARLKQVDVSEECKLTRAEPYVWYDRENIQHQCDTLGGSSGSPVLDRETGDVIGLHWGATGGTDSNHAIPMWRILEQLETEVPAVYAELTVVE